MTQSTHFIEVDGIPVEVVRKRIKHINLRVYPPDGRVRLAAPLRTDEATVRQMVSSRLEWIQRQRVRLMGHPQQGEPTMLPGEAHWFLGRRYHLDIRENSSRRGVHLQGDSALELHTRGSADTNRRAALLQAWYRQQMQVLLPELIARWEPVVDVRIAECRIKRMKTRWGSCNIAARRIWLNLELIKRPIMSLEYVLMHEMTHLLERYHNTRFYSLMDDFMPEWRIHRHALDQPHPQHDSLITSAANE